MKPIQVIYGTEDYLIDEYKNKLIAQVIGEVDEFNYSSFDMEELEVEAALSDASTLSFMGGKRVVLVKNAIFLTGGREMKKIEHDLERLNDYLKKPNEMTTIIVTVSAEKLDGRKKVVKELKKVADIKVCNELFPNQLRPFITKQIAESGATIKPEAVERLILLVGGNLHALTNEINKLVLFAQDKTINEEMVTNMISRNVEQDVFLLVDHIVKRKLDAAQLVLTDLIKKKEEPIKIIALLAYKVRLILQVKILLKKGFPLPKIAKELGSAPYPVQLAAEQSNDFEEKELYEFLNSLTTLDYKMKTGQIDKILGLEMLICDIGGKFQSLLFHGRLLKKKTMIVCSSLIYSAFVNEEKN